MAAAFGPSRTRERRSTAYKVGARSYLEFKARGYESVCSYAAGTPEFDAYFAGLDEGREIWRAHQQRTPQ